MNESKRLDNYQKPPILRCLQSGKIVLVPIWESLLNSYLNQEEWKSFIELVESNPETTASYNSDLRLFATIMYNIKIGQNTDALTYEFKLGTDEKGSDKSLSILLLGKIYYHQENYKKVIELFEEAGMIDSKLRVYIVSNLAHAYFVTERFEKAAELYSTIPLVDEDAVASYCISLIQTDRDEDADGVASEFRRGIEWVPRFLHVQLGRVYCLKGNWEKGMSRIYRALDYITCADKEWDAIWSISKKCIFELIEIGSQDDHTELMYILMNIVSDNRDGPLRVEALEIHDLLTETTNYIRSESDTV